LVSLLYSKTPYIEANISLLAALLPSNEDKDTVLRNFGIYRDSLSWRKKLIVIGTALDQAIYHATYSLSEHHSDFELNYHKWDPNQELELGIRNGGYLGGAKSVHYKYPYSVDVTSVPISQQAGMDLVNWDAV